MIVPGSASLPTPEFTMLGVPLPGGRKRLYATRKFRRAAFRQDGEDDDAAWALSATMTDVLVVDRDDYAEAIRWVLARWAREDTAATPAIGGRDSLPTRPRRRALENHREA